eukprot:scaffold3139_cov110-Isochrysis_galbana.AAC.7
MRYVLSASSSSTPASRSRSRSWSASTKSRARLATMRCSSSPSSVAWSVSDMTTEPSSAREKP